MDEKSEEIIKKHMQNTKEYSKFKKLIKDMGFKLNLYNAKRLNKLCGLTEK